jgi:hypothetical protein
MISYQWQITGIDVAPNWNELTNVVRTIHARYIGTDGISTTFLVLACDVQDPDPENYVAFNTLTEQSTINWLEARCDVASMQMMINTKLNPETQPLVVTVAPPWQ